MGAVEVSQQIEQVPVADLVPYARNSRTHSDEQVEQIARSIREFGFTNPVLIDGAGEIVAGHGRILGARKIGMEMVPCIRLLHLSEAQRRDYVIADNKLALNAGWDDALLSVEIKDLAEIGFDLTLTGFTLDGVQELDVMPELPTGNKEPFQQMTFTLHDSQAEQVVAALDAAKRMGKFVDSPNENGNGNALARICETFLTQNGNS